MRCSLKQSVLTFSDEETSSASSRSDATFVVFYFPVRGIIINPSHSCWNLKLHYKLKHTNQMLHFGTHWIMGTGIGSDPHSGPYSKMWLLKPKKKRLWVQIFAQRSTYTYTFYYYWNPTFSKNYMFMSLPSKIRANYLQVRAVINTRR